MKAKLLLVWLLLLTSCVFATTLHRGLSPSIKYENNPKFYEAYRIRIENTAGGLIEVSKDGGSSWEAVGKVLYPTQKLSKRGYAAAKWVNPGKVAATAVNAIHIKTGPKDWDRSIFSILPKEFLLPPRKYRSFLSPDSSIYTDIPAGQGIFGGGFSPLVGNTIMLSKPAGPVTSIPKNYVPKVDDVFYILVERPRDSPKEIVFENRFGGRIYIHYYSGANKIIGEILRPVVGIGRFEGTKFVGPGRIRANHAGVIDISVSPCDSLGGFQIVPALHGTHMSYVKKMTQWMVVGPTNVEDPSLEGMAPLFRYFLYPSYRPDDIEAEDWEEKLLNRFLVEVMYEGIEEWKPMPVFSLRKDRALPGWANSVFDKVAYFRILFPIEN